MGYADSKKQNILPEDEDTLGLDRNQSSSYDVACISKKLAHSASPYSNVPTCLICDGVIERVHTDTTALHTCPKANVPVLTHLKTAIALHHDAISPPNVQFQCAFHGTAADDNHITVPIYINDIKYTALLDTGCTSTSIDP